MRSPELRHGDHADEPCTEEHNPYDQYELAICPYVRIRIPGLVPQPLERVLASSGDHRQ